MNVRELLQQVLWRAAASVDEWRGSAIGGLLVVIAGCCFVLVWLALPDEAVA